MPGFWFQNGRKTHCNPAAVSSTTDSATWATTSAARDRFWRLLAVPLRPPSFNCSFGSMRDACSAELHQRPTR